MTDYEMHEVSYSGTTTDDWSAPQQGDFDTDDRSEIADHFLLSESGFPPDAFGDLRLPVVDPDGNLNLNALETAYAGGHSVEAVDDIDDETVEAVQDTIESLAEEEFDHEIE